MSQFKTFCQNGTSEMQPPSVSELKATALNSCLPPLSNSMGNSRFRCFPQQMGTRKLYPVQLTPPPPPPSLKERNVLDTQKNKGSYNIGVSLAFPESSASLAFHRLLQSLKLTPLPQTPRLWLAHFGLKETRNSAPGCGDGGRVCEKDFFHFLLLFLASNFYSVTLL